MELVIKKGGVLWNADKEKNVTDSAPSCLFDHCILDDDVTLRDIFLLLEKHEDVFEMIIGNWMKEIIHEGLYKEPKENEEQEIEYLELYWCLENWDLKDLKEFNGLSFPSFHGVGFEQKEDKYIDDVKEDGMLECKAGDRINWAIEFNPANEMIDLPVKLSEKVTLTENLEKEVDGRNWTSKEFLNPHYTLGHILHGIIWELSFCGSPEDRDEKKEDLNQRVDDIKSGKEELVEFETPEELINRIDEE